MGNVAIVAPTAAVIGAGIPVLVGIALQGIPKLLLKTGIGIFPTLPSGRSVE